MYYEFEVGKFLLNLMNHPLLKPFEAFEFNSEKTNIISQVPHLTSMNKSMTLVTCYIYKDMISLSKIEFQNSRNHLRFQHSPWAKRKINRNDSSSIKMLSGHLMAQEKTISSITS